MAKIQKKASVTSKSIGYNLTDKNVLLLTLLVATSYYIYSFFSNGFYQHDEVSHYLSMVGFWDKPESILGNWAKTGYKLVYIFPALLGANAVIIFNCLVSAFTCYICYKIAKRLNSSIPILAFFLLAFQPFWVQLSFRNYADGFSGFVLALAVYFHYEKKIGWACLLLSFASIVRQEFYVLLPMYGLYLLANKKIIHCFILGVFPVLYWLWTYIETKDALYMYTSIVETSQKYADEWPRQGFDHYFKMSITIFGAIAVALFILYFSETIMDGIAWVKEKMAKVKEEKDEQVESAVIAPHWVFIICITYFLIHCVFNWQSVKIGAATGGNLRYMVAISPLIAVLGTVAIDKFNLAKEKINYYVIFAIYVIMVGLYLTYQNNNIVLTEEKDAKPLVFTIIALVGILFPFKQKQKINYLVLLGVFSLFLSIKPFKIQPEEVAIQKMVNWLVENKYTQNRDVLSNHVIFRFFWDKKENKTHKTVNLDSLTIDHAPKGSMLIWETHYSYRPNLNELHVKYDYLRNNPTKFKEIKNFVATNNRFQIFAFEKQ